jgi:Na+-driven multidrug efflux pump
MAGKHSKVAQPSAAERRHAAPSPTIALFASFLCLLVQELGILIPLGVAYHLGQSELLQTLQALFPAAHIGAIPATWLGIGCSIAVARAYGSSDEDALSDSVHTAVALALIFGFPASVLTTLVAQPTLSLFSIPPQLATDALDFWYLSCGASFVSVSFNVLLGIQRAVGQNLLSLVCSLVAALASAVLSVELTGALGMGAKGAALALAAGQLVGGALCLAMLTRSRRPYRLRLARVRVVWKQASNILACSASLVAQALAIAAFQLLSPTFVTDFGEEMCAAWDLVHWLELALVVVANAFAITTATFVARAFGSSSYDEMRGVSRRLLPSGIVAMGALSASACILARQLGELLALGASVTELVALMAPLTLPFMVLYTIVVVIGAALRGADVNMQPTVASIAGLSMAPLIWLVLALPRLHTIVTVALARPLTWGVTAAIMLVYYRHGRWLTLAMRKARKERNSSSNRRRRRSRNARHRA